MAAAAGADAAAAIEGEELSGHYTIQAVHSSKYLSFDSNAERCAVVQRDEPHIWTLCRALTEHATVFYTICSKSTGKSLSWRLCVYDFVVFRFFSDSFCCLPV